MQEKEGAAISFDTVLGSFRTIQDSLILHLFFSSITRTLRIWTSIDLRVFFWQWQRAEEGKKKSGLGKLLCLSHILKYATPI